MNDTPIDPALAENIDEITDMLREIGASGTWLLRDVGNVDIRFRDAGGEPFTLAIDDAGLILVARFPAGDGRGPDVETR